MMNLNTVAIATNGELVDLHFAEFSNNVIIVNTTPHPINIQDVDGEVAVVPESVLVNAKAIEKPVENKPLFVKTEFVGTDEGRKLLTKIETKFDLCYPDWKEQCKELIIIGSIIAAQAYPGEVVGMIPAPGFERVPPAEKRMRCDKFTSYEKGGDDKHGEIIKLLDELDIMKSRDNSIENIPVWDAFDELKKLLK